MKFYTTRYLLTNPVKTLALQYDEVTETAHVVAGSLNDYSFKWVKFYMRNSSASLISVSSFY